MADSAYTERYMGFPQPGDNLQGYRVWISGVTFVACCTQTAKCTCSIMYVVVFICVFFVAYVFLTTEKQLTSGAYLTIRCER